MGDELALEQLVPKLPGLYMWTRDLRLWLGRQEEEIQSLLQQLLGDTGLGGSSGAAPYYRLSVQEIRRPVSEEKFNMLVHWIHDASGSLGRWITTLGTEHQRPLYVGLTRNLFRRIVQEHLRQQSVLRQRLESVQIDLSDCAITYTLLPQPILSALTVSYESGHAAPERDREISEDDQEGEGELTFIDQQLKAAESFLIRLTMPLFNLRQD